MSKLTSILSTSSNPVPVPFVLSFGKKVVGKLKILRHKIRNPLDVLISLDRVEEKRTGQTVKEIPIDAFVLSRLPGWIWHYTSIIHSSMSRNAAPPKDRSRLIYLEQD